MYSPVDEEERLPLGNEQTACSGSEDDIDEEGVGEIMAKLGLRRRMTIQLQRSRESKAGQAALALGKFALLKLGVSVEEVGFISLLLCTS